MKPEESRKYYRLCSNNFATDYKFTMADRASLVKAKLDSSLLSDNNKFRISIGRKSVGLVWVDLMSVLCCGFNVGLELR